MFHQIILFVFLGVLLSFAPPGTIASIAGISCLNQDLCLTYLPLCQQLTVFPCNYDVQVFHGANSGYCEYSAYNCIANYTGPVVPGGGGVTGAVINQCNAQNFTLCQCQYNLSSEITTAYQEFCDFDCRCDHGGSSGSCDFLNRKCICNYESTWTSAQCPEFTPLGVNLSALSINVATFVNSFCTVTLPLLGYQATYCAPTGTPTGANLLNRLADILAWLGGWLTGWAG